MFSSIACRYDLANTVLSMGIHHLWKRSIAQAVPKNSAVLDLCTGTGDLLPLLKKRAGTVIGADFCFPMLEIASKRSKIPLCQADALNLPFTDAQFDAVTVAFGIRNLEDRAKGLSEIYRVLRPGGILLILEFGQPTIPVWSELYIFYSKFIMPLIGSALTGNKFAYEYLPETSKAFPSRELFSAELKESGYTNISYRSFSGGIAYLYTAYR
jgi:demethylmenaquinone methyltransferase/2-methoxy-6-polyprenyl-1,4-benzoquinol methylase